MARSAKNRRRTAQTQKLTAATPPSEAAAGSGTTRTLPLDSVNEIVWLPDWAVQTPAFLTNVSGP